MIDRYTKEVALLVYGHDEFWLSTRNNDQISYNYYSEIGEDLMINTIKKIGEDDGICSIFWLKDLDGVCHIDCEGYACTDVIGAYVGSDNMLSISVFSADDKASLFVSIYDLPWGVVDAIYDQIMAR